MIIEEAEANKCKVYFCFVDFLNPLTLFLTHLVPDAQDVGLTAGSGVLSYENI